MNHGRLLGIAIAAITALLTSGAIAQERNACLMHSQIEDMLQLDDDQLVLLVDGGTSVYLLDLEDDCFAGSLHSNLALRSSYEDGCIRTTDTVIYGRRDCRIQSFSLVETQEQLDAVIASLR